ncbi:beta-lactamase family protein [Dactylosporangium vinaceum]|uniref:Serine hydrolase domain-containing protein n=1 Tax=Dactylosporangium vinaceum TaxID=53362 RepID=A0ABV5M221_9ACTN|nr:serine hydrolase domain-containing protein [Dactylosporangium vinaceum]UAB99288.1 beta-lactamase family protein [Dactylosporangium vinaceum]
MVDPVSGTVEKGFEAVAEAFRAQLESGAETGAAVAAYAGGELVVDLWGGWADAARTRPWTADTLVTVFSAGKPVAALAVLARVADGRIGLDEPVATYWPAFTDPRGTVRHALAHQLGLPAIAEPLTAADGLDWARCTAAIAASPLEWAPGTAVGEHALTYGNILGAILRGATGETVGDVVRGFGLDVHFGLSAADQARCAEVEHGSPDWPEQAVHGHGDLWARALGNPAGLLDTAVLNGPGWRGGELPAVNLHATARGLAGVYHALPRLLPADLLAEALAPQATGVDRLLEEEAVWTLGWRRDDTWVGMGGIGGSSAGGFATATGGYWLAYVTRHLADHERSTAVYDAMEASLGKPLS